ncbi:hypothetical protein RYX36_007366, partial [Vicia faba]
EDYMNLLTQATQTNNVDVDGSKKSEAESQAIEAARAEAELANAYVDEAKAEVALANTHVEEAK